MWIKKDNDTIYIQGEDDKEYSFTPKNNTWYGLCLAGDGNFYLNGYMQSAIKDN